MSMPFSQFLLSLPAFIGAITAAKKTYSYYFFGWDVFALFWSRLSPECSLFNTIGSVFYSIFLLRDFDTSFSIHAKNKFKRFTYYSIDWNDHFSFNYNYLEVYTYQEFNIRTGKQKGLIKTSPSDAENYMKAAPTKEMKL